MNSLPRMGLTVGAMLALWCGLASSTPPTTSDTVPPESASASSSGEVRLIVRFKDGASSLRMKALSARATDSEIRQVSQMRATALGKRVGLELSSQRAMDARTHVMRASGVDASTLLRRVRADSEVELVAIDHRRRALFVPNDPLYTTGGDTSAGAQGPTVGQWYLKAPSTVPDANGQVVLSSINAEKAWDINSGSGSVVVAVLDTGVRFDHPDLASSFVSKGYSMISDSRYSNDSLGRHADATDPGDWVTTAQVNTSGGVFYHCTTPDSSGKYSGENSSWHGTQVSGLIAAGFNNGIGMSGAGGNVRVLPVRVLGTCGGFDSDIIDGMKWAAGLPVSGVPNNPTPAKVLNMSLGGSGSCATDASNANAATAQLYRDAINAVQGQGAVVVAAAGNDEGLAVGLPANCPGVIAVAAVRHTGTKVGFSNIGPEVSISAPGGNCVNSSGACLYPMLSTVNSGTTTPVSNDGSYTNSYQYGIGTSFATPLVSGTAALMFSANPSLTPSQITSLLQSTASTFPAAPAVPTSTTPPQCQAPSSAVQDECFCTTSTCGAGMVNSYAAVAAAASVKITQAPLVVIGGAAGKQAVGRAVALDAASSVVYGGSKAVSYQWAVVNASGKAQFSGATNTANTTLVASNAGTSTVSVQLTDSAGLSSTVSKALSFVSQPTATVVAVSQPLKVGDALRLDGSGSTASGGATIASYAWTISSGAGNVQFTSGTGAATVTVQGVAAGSATIVLTVTDSNGVSASASQTLTVIAPPTAAISATPDPVTAGNSVSLSASGSTPAGNATLASYSWSISSGGSIASLSGATNAATATLATTAAGSVTVVLTVVDSNGLSSTASRTLTVSAASNGGTSGGGSGSTSSGSKGGGAMQPGWLLGLLLAAGLLRRGRPSA